MLGFILNNLEFWTISKNDTHFWCQLLKEISAESFEASWQQKSNVLKDSRMWIRQTFQRKPALSRDKIPWTRDRCWSETFFLGRTALCGGPHGNALRSRWCMPGESELASLPREHARPGPDVRNRRDVDRLVTIKQRMTHMLKDDSEILRLGWMKTFCLWLYNLLGGNLIYPETKKIGQLDRKSHENEKTCGRHCGEGGVMLCWCCLILSTASRWDYKLTFWTTESPTERMSQGNVNPGGAKHLSYLGFQGELKPKW